jgi:predicted TIM-barrel fold metal-dependent hydrolase
VTALTVDAHHPIWRRADLPWLSGPMVPRIFGPYESVRRDYPIAEYIADATPCGVARSVYVQTNWPLDRALDEVRWVEAVAQEAGWPHAIVGAADFLSDSCAEVLRAQSAASPRMRGSRMQLHWHENPNFRFAPAPDVANNPQFRRNLSRLQDFGWLFELQVFSAQMRDAARLVADFPGIPFVLIHAGMLEGPTPREREAWLEGMKRLAECPNAFVKLSGQGTFIHAVDKDFIADVVRECLRLFGSTRCVFGSNFPIEKIWTNYESLFKTYQEVLADYSVEVREDVFGRTAARLYRLA